MEFLAQVWPYIAVLLVTVVTPLLISGDIPLGAVRVINYLKKKLGLEGEAAIALSVAMSIILAALVALADGVFQITGPMTPEKFSVIVVTMFGGSQLWYSRLKKEMGNGEE